MRKILSILLIGVLLVAMLGLAGCGEESQQLTVAEGILTVAVSPDFAPMEFVDTTKTGQDQYVGVDVEFARVLAKNMGLELLIKPMSFEACQTAVQSGIVDMSISGFSYTEERNEKFLCSDFYQTLDTDTAQVILVGADDAERFTSAEDFAGLSVGAQAASIQLTLCKEQLPDSTEVVEYAEMEKAVDAFNDGNIQAIAVARYNGESIIANNPNLGFSGFAFVLSENQDQNVVLMKKGREDLAAYVNETIAQLTAEEKFYQWYVEATEMFSGENTENVSYDEKGEQLTD